MPLKNSKLTIFIILSLIISPITWASDNKNRYITVIGHGKISAIPDTAWVTGGFTHKLKQLLRH